MLKSLMFSYLRKPLLSSPTPNLARLIPVTTNIRLLSFTANAPAHQPASGASPSATTLDPIPPALVHELRSSHPLPIRHEFLGDKVTSEMLEKIDIGLNKHRVPTTLSDSLAYHTVKLLRWLPDSYFKNNHYMRVVMLETVAAVPGMVGGMLRHLRSLRKVNHDGGWIIHLLHEAENERMHLLTWMKCLQPSRFDRWLILGVQGAFFNTYFMLYLVSPRTAHRLCGYLEEEAVVSYTHFLRDIDEGKIKNSPAPRIAKEYWNLLPEATIRDVVLAVRADEALHRDSNHHFADRIAAGQEDLRSDVDALLKSPEWQKQLGSVSEDAQQKWGKGQAMT